MNMEKDNKTEKKTKKEEIEKIPTEKIRGRVIIFDSEKSEIAQNLKLGKKGDYAQKKS